MAFKAEQQVIHNIGSVVNWLTRSDLCGRRMLLVDLDGQVVGRAAAQISSALQGKDRPDYQPTSNGGDVVVAINASRAMLTGKKMREKVYYSHSGKPGNLKEESPAELWHRFGGAEVVWRAVNGMLPKNRLRKRRMDRLLVYNDANHDFDDAALFPLSLAVRKLRPDGLRWRIPEGYTPVNPESHSILWRGCNESPALAHDGEDHELKGNQESVPGLDGDTGLSESEAAHQNRVVDNSNPVHEQGLRLQ